MRGKHKKNWINSMQCVFNWYFKFNVTCKLQCYTRIVGGGGVSECSFFAVFHLAIFGSALRWKWFKCLIGIGNYGARTTSSFYVYQHRMNIMLLIRKFIFMRAKHNRPLLSLNMQLFCCNYSKRNIFGEGERRKKHLPELLGKKTKILKEFMEIFL